MVFEINFTPIAATHVRAYRKFEQQIILDAIEEQLRYEPMTETRQRKKVGREFTIRLGAACAEISRVLRYPHQG